MLGAIIGDVSGSRFEWENIKHKNFKMFRSDSRMTDDSVMTAAVADALLTYKDEGGDLEVLAVEKMQTYGRRHLDAGYGKRFYAWLLSDMPEPYNSFGNGAAMRVSPCGFLAESMEEAACFAECVTRVTHNHPEALKAARCLAEMIYLLKTDHSKEMVESYVKENYYALDFTLDAIRDDYAFDVSCQGSVPQAIEAFIESSDFEDAVRLAISIGGDSDTIAAIAGGLAEAFYGIPQRLIRGVTPYLSADIGNVVYRFYGTYRQKE